MLERNCDPQQLPINYDLLKERSDKEYHRLDKIKEYSYGQSCRHRYILHHFGDHSTLKDKCGNCDFCLKPARKKSIKKDSLSEKNLKDLNVGSIEKVILMTLSNCSGRFGQKVIIDILKGSNNQLIRKWKLDKSTFHGYFKSHSRDKLEMILADMIMNGYILKQKGLYPVLTISDLGLKMLGELSDDRSFRQEVARTETDKKIKIDERIIKTISLCGFDDKKRIISESGEGVTEKDVDRVVAKIKKEFMSYLRKKYLKDSR